MVFIRLGAKNLEFFFCLLFTNCISSFRWSVYDSIIHYTYSKYSPEYGTLMAQIETDYPVPRTVYRSNTSRVEH